jgi:hypothetical protein
MDRPILFSGPMVRAILDGRKTQTRRVVQACGTPCQKDDGSWLDVWEEGRLPCGGMEREVAKPLRVPCAPGDRLWVRERWSGIHEFRNTKPSERESFVGDGVPYLRDDIWYWADGEPEGGDYEPPRVSLHMPRWASRLTLTVTDVRVQRLQEISEADAIAEGCEASGWRPSFADPDNTAGHENMSARDAFAALWDSLNLSRGHPWINNPWCCVVSFTAHKINIDDFLPQRQEEE